MAVYLDYNATTPVDPAVFEAMRPWLTTHWGNPSSGHAFGREASRALARGREQVAALIGAHPDEIVFTGGGTEADNLALLGDPRPTGRLVLSAVEHPAVEGPAVWLEARGWRVARLAVDGRGLVDLVRARDTLAAGVDLLSLIVAQNETGVVQPVAELAGAAREHSDGVVVHADGAQAVGKIPVDVDTLGVDLLTIVGHKLYAPCGIGALYVRRGRTIRPRTSGGGQERGLRPGTEPVALVVALGAACERAGADLADEAIRLARLRDDLWERLRAGVPGLRCTGEGATRLPNTLHVRFPGVDGAAVLAAASEVAASTGSACHSDADAPSGALGAMGLSVEDARGAVRLSLGRPTSEAEVRTAATALVAAYQRVRGRD